MNKHVIIVSGPQGSGKTTQAERLAERLDYALFEAGVQLRAFADAGKPGSVEVDQMMREGVLVPHHYVNNLFFEFVEQNRDKAGIVTDGFPRSLEQWHVIETTANHLDADVLGVFIQLSEEIAIDRIAKRVEKHGRVVEKRDDDTPAAIRRRFAVYHQETEPVLNLLKEQHHLIEIDGSKTIDEVTDQINLKLDPIINVTRVG